MTASSKSNMLSQSVWILPGLISLMLFPTVCYSQACDRTFCTPESGDLVIGRQEFLKATSTCGMNGIESYCVVTNKDREQRCNICYSKERYNKQLNPNNHEISNVMSRIPAEPNRWWQSEPGVHNVTIHIDFGQEFQFIYTQLRFKTFRPAAMILERSIDNSRTWIPYAYYSNNCKKDFPDVLEGRRHFFDTATCISDYSSLEPSEDGLVTFTAVPTYLQTQYDIFSTEVQKYRKMTNLRARFIRLNTLGDLGIENSEKTQSKYYYAVYEWVIRGTCSCYGHGKCVRGPTEPEEVKNMVYGMCECQHNTGGANCEDCLPLFRDRQWKIAEKDNVNECKKCECNGHADLCEFSPILFTYSGNVTGGRCIDCLHNTAGEKCDKCLDTYYQVPGLSLRSPYICQPCQCTRSGLRPDLEIGETVCYQYSDNTTGIVAGQCKCRENVNGKNCDRCKSGFWKLNVSNPLGCQPCGCLTMGSYGNLGCDQVTGQCQCKRFVTGETCDKCMTGYYNLSTIEDGCSPCQCSERTSVQPLCDLITGQCQCKMGFTGRRCTDIKDEFFINIPVRIIRIDDKSFTVDLDPPKESGLYNVLISTKPSQLGDWEQWKVKISVDQVNREQCQASESQVMTITPRSNNDTLWFVLPSVCLEKDKPTRVIFDVQVQPDNNNAYFKIEDIVLIPFDLGTRQPDKTTIEICERYVNNPNQQIPDMCKVYVKGRNANPDPFPDDVTATRCECDPIGAVNNNCEKLNGQCECKPGVKGRKCNLCEENFYGFSVTGCKACNCSTQGSPLGSCDINTGQCQCYPNIVGLQCDTCTRGTWGFDMNCRECQCNGLAEVCDQLTGKCLNCTDFTEGDSCERCKPYYFGDPITKRSCQPCMCPGQGEVDNSHGCSLDTTTGGQKCQCKYGYAGAKCDQCDVNFFGDPMKKGGSCKPCSCNNNIDIYVPNSCDPTTGYCNKCLFNTDGISCDSCASGYFGNALERNCKPCVCNKLGTLKDTQCDPKSGKCQCQPNVIGDYCDACKSNHFNLSSGLGCEACDCDHVGASIVDDCNVLDGTCACNENYGGRRCNKCKPYHYGVPSVKKGCKPCKCNEDGTETQQCDWDTGKCKCRVGVVGDKCDQCDRGTSGQLPECKPCGECWTNWDKLVMEMKNSTDRLVELAGEQALRGFSPALRDEYNRVKAKVDDLLFKLSNTSVSTAQPQDTEALVQLFEEIKQLIKDNSLSPEEIRSKDMDLQSEGKNADTQKEKVRNLQALYEFVNEQLSEIQKSAKDISLKNIAGAYQAVKDFAEKANVARKTMTDSIKPDVKKNAELLKAKNIEFNKLKANNPISPEVLDKIQKLNDRLTALNKEYCGNDNAHGSNPAKCESSCGGAGCSICGGEGICSESVKSKFDKMNEEINRLKDDFFYFKNNILNHADKQMPKLRILAEQTVNASGDAMVYAQEMMKFVGNYTDETRAYLDAVREYISNYSASNYTKENYDDLSQRIRSIKIGIKAGDIVDALKSSYTDLDFVDSILAETKDNLTRAASLQSRAAKIKSDADSLDQNVTEVKTRLQESKQKLDEAGRNILKPGQLKSSIQNIQPSFDRNQRDASDAVDSKQRSLNDLKATIIATNDTVSKKEAAFDTTRRQLSNITDNIAAVRKMDTDINTQAVQVEEKIAEVKRFRDSSKILQRALEMREKIQQKIDILKNFKVEVERENIRLINESKKYNQRLENMNNDVSMYLAEMMDTVGENYDSVFH